jgi:hypothetical protein
MDNDSRADELTMMRAAVAPSNTSLSRMLQERMVQNAIQTILSDRASYPKSLNYAVEYCRAARLMSGEELRVQCLYILGNITRWRHEKAKEVRATLKAFTK